jgi:hypothetical protein
MSNRILVNPGTEQAWEISLKPGVNRIGRSEDNDFTINHTSVSTHHCEIIVSDAGVMLKDLGSTNGTFINRSPVQEVWLQPGQHIQFGAIDTIFESYQPASAPPQPSQPAPGATVVVAAVGSPPAIHPPASTGLRINRPEAPVEAAPAAAPTPAAARVTGRPGRFPVHVAAEREAASKKRFLLGAVGAVVGGLLGATVWYFLIKSTGSAFALVAWGVGAVTGLGAILLAKQGSLGLGVLSATCALLAIVFGEYLAVKAIVTKEGTKMAAFAYVTELEFARQAVKAETPEDLRKLLAEEKEKNPEEITDEHIKKFRDEELPRLRDLSKGKPSRAEYAKALGKKFADEFDYKEFFFHEDVKSGLFMVLFAVLGIASAYKIASGEESGD